MACPRTFALAVFSARIVPTPAHPIFSRASSFSSSRSWLQHHALREALSGTWAKGPSPETLPSPDPVILLPYLMTHSLLPSPPPPTAPAAWEDPGKALHPCWSDEPHIPCHCLDAQLLPPKPRPAPRTPDPISGFPRPGFTSTFWRLGAEPSQNLSQPLKASGE